jgi:hypothetical protein
MEVFRPCRRIATPITLGKKPLALLVCRHFAIRVAANFRLG